MDIKRLVSRAKSQIKGVTNKDLDTMRNRLPTAHLLPKEKEFIYNYSGNVLASVKKTWGVSGIEAKMKAHDLMAMAAVRKCLETLDIAFERYGLKTSLELRAMLEDIAAHGDKDSDRLSAIKLLMTDRGMIGAKACESVGKNPETR